MSKPDLLIAPCSYEAAKYAVEHWHYSQSLSVSKNVFFGVWENSLFIGAIVFGRGANKNMLKPYNLKIVEGCELTRVALNHHVSPVSQIVSQSIKLLKQTAPELKLIVSYADPSQGHQGIVYQAMNWIYQGTIKSTPKYLHKGHWVHAKTLHPLQGSAVGVMSKPNPDKHKYLYPLSRAMRKQIEPLAQPYPKQ